jgi:hypothetical protein
MCKPGAAFGAAAFHYIAPSFCSHPFYKTMFSGALAFFGLVGPFWHMYLLS